MKRYILLAFIIFIAQRINSGNIWYVNGANDTQTNVWVEVDGVDTKSNSTWTLQQTQRAIKIMGNIYKGSYERVVWK